MTDTTARTQDLTWGDVFDACTFEEPRSMGTTVALAYRDVLQERAARAARPAEHKLARQLARALQLA